MIKFNLNITTSKLLAIIVIVAGIAISLILKESIPFEVGCISGTALVGVKTYTTSKLNRDELKYKQEPKETID